MGKDRSETCFFRCTRLCKACGSSCQHPTDKVKILLKGKAGCAFAAGDIQSK